VATFWKYFGSIWKLVWAYFYLTNTAPLSSRKIVTDFRWTYFVVHRIIFFVSITNHYCGSWYLYTTLVNTFIYRIMYLLIQKSMWHKKETQSLKSCYVYYFNLSPLIATLKWKENITYTCQNSQPDRLRMAGQTAAKVSYFTGNSSDTSTEADL